MCLQSSERTQFSLNIYVLNYEAFAHYTNIKGKMFLSRRVYSLQKKSPLSIPRFAIYSTRKGYS